MRLVHASTSAEQLLDCNKASIIITAIAGSYQQWECQAEALRRFLATVTPHQLADQVCASSDVTPLIAAASLQQTKKC
jgi:hypothetical protein